MKIKEPKTKLPKVLYKYRDIHNPLHLETLEKQMLFLSSAYRFNDPFDCKIPLEYLNVAKDENLRRDFAIKIAMANQIDKSREEIESQVDKMITKGFLKKEDLSMLEKKNLKRLNEYYGIYSLSADPSNILLWSHYANCHKGICIGFNAKKLLKFGGLDAVGPVAYFATYPNLNVLRDNEDLLYNQVYNKSIAWAYEQEYRYIKLEGADTKIQFPVNALEEIYIGCMASSKTESIVKKLRANKYPKARLYKCKKSKMGYFLEREAI